jgi:hypothetical protein
MHLASLPAHSIAKFVHNGCMQCGQPRLRNIEAVVQAAPLDGSAPDLLLSRLPESHSTSCPPRPIQTHPRPSSTPQAQARSCAHRTGLLFRCTAAGTVRCYSSISIWWGNAADKGSLVSWNVYLKFHEASHVGEHSMGAKFSGSLSLASHASRCKLCQYAWLSSHSRHAIA